MKKIFLPLCLVVLIGLSFFVMASMTPVSTAVYTTKYDVNIHLERGWNLVPFFLPSTIKSKSEIQVNDIGAIWSWLPPLKRYYQLFPVNHIDDLPVEIGRTLEESEIISASVWVYSEKSGDIGYLTPEGILNSRTLYKGWNFVAITPDMVGRTFGEILSECNILKGAEFTAYNGKWSIFSGELISSDFPIEGDVGITLVVKVDNECSLKGWVGGRPPTIPDDNLNLGEDFKCSDSDRGKNYDVKGNVKISDSTEPLGYEIEEDICLGDDKSLMERFCQNGEAEGETHLCPNGCVDGACSGGNESSIQILEQDFGSFKFRSAGKLNDKDSEEMFSFSLEQVIDQKIVNYYHSPTGADVSVIIIKFSGDKNSFLNKLLKAYEDNNFSIELLTPLADPILYKLNDKNNINNELAIWVSSDYLIQVDGTEDGGTQVLKDGSDAYQIIKDYFNKYPSTLK